MNEILDMYGYDRVTLNTSSSPSNPPEVDAPEVEAPEVEAPEADTPEPETPAPETTTPVQEVNKQDDDDDEEEEEEDAPEAEVTGRVVLVKCEVTSDCDDQCVRGLQAGASTRQGDDDQPSTPETDNGQGRRTGL